MFHRLLLEILLCRIPRIRCCAPLYGRMFGYQRFLNFLFPPPSLVRSHLKFHTQNIMSCTIWKNGTHETLHCIHHLKYAPLHLLSITIILPDEDSRSPMWRYSWKEGERVTVKPYMYVAPVLRGNSNSTSLLFLHSLSFL